MQSDSWRFCYIKLSFISLISSILIQWYVMYAWYGIKNNSQFLVACLLYIIYICGCLGAGRWAVFKTQQVWRQEEGFGKEAKHHSGKYLSELIARYISCLLNFIQIEFFGSHSYGLLPGSLGYLPRCSAHRATPARPRWRIGEWPLAKG